MHAKACLAKRRMGVWCSLSNAGPRVPRGGVTRQGVVLTDLQSLVVNKLLSHLIVKKLLSHTHTHKRSLSGMENPVRLCIEAKYQGRCGETK